MIGLKKKHILGAKAKSFKECDLARECFGQWQGLRAFA
jgi:hypothetical protein